LSGAFKPKDEFETTDAYIARIDAVPVDSSEVVFVKVGMFDPLSSLVSYDADSQELTISLDAVNVMDMVSPGIALDQYSCLPVLRTAHRQSQSIGSNAFGAAKVIQETNSTFYGLVPTNDLGCDSGVGQSISFKLGMLPDDARRISRYANATLFLGRYERTTGHTAAFSGSNYSKPTMDSPYEETINANCVSMRLESVWLFDRRTGDVLLKHSFLGSRPTIFTRGSTFASGDNVLNAATGAPVEEVAVITTDMGTIVLRFYDHDAPQSVANFKKLVRQGFYDGTTFHRVIPGFVVQGGDPNSKDSDRSNDGLGGPGYTVPAEIRQSNVRGAIATARLPDQVNPTRASSGSQFYICLSDLPSLDKGGYTVFGEVVEGMDVADKISQVERDERDNPLQPVVMRKVTIEVRPVQSSSLGKE